jgi:hypothetical protein
MEKEIVSELKSINKILTDHSVLLGEHTTLLNQNIKSSEKTEKHLEKQNGRIGAIEEKVTEVEKDVIKVKGTTDGIVANCNRIQEFKTLEEERIREEEQVSYNKKHNRLIRIIMIGSLILGAIGLWNRSLNKTLINYEVKKISNLTTVIDSLKAIERKDSIELRKKGIIRLKRPYNLRTRAGTMIEYVDTLYYPINKQ